MAESKAGTVSLRQDRDKSTEGSHEETNHPHSLPVCVMLSLNPKSSNPLTISLQNLTILDRSRGSAQRKWKQKVTNFRA
ncbi:hypothetical protein E2C01_093085 [Portunus trituberculatus]|uniref:Uncharacterized protein n=1 Tax=Portunus trituberculatus TaxID=210409 RepID=A0A5B7JTY5_PORTR|nr:hypothetical protein [Portunus trituberculatus]